MNRRQRRSAAALLAAILLAAALPWPPAAARAADEITIAFDPSGEHSCLTADPFVTVVAYLLVLYPAASSGISGWECTLQYPSHAVLVSTTLAGVNPMNFGTPPAFQVGIGGGPLPYAPAVELARFSFLLTSASPISFVILPFDPPSLPDGLPVYADGANPNVLRTLTPRVIYGENVVAGINLPGCSPEALTWGDIKRIYE